MGRSLFTILFASFPVSSTRMFGLSSGRRVLGRTTVLMVTYLVCADVSAQVGGQNMPNPVSGASPPASNSFQPESPIMTFMDPRSGQMYGRYVLYETVPVAKYEYKPVVERQFVPEWVQETKTTTQVQYVPVITYQLQPVQAPTWNPFSTPKQYWQYVPQVQYQPRYLQTNQPITYQKYVEKEVTKYVPEMVVKQERVPQFADRPLASATYLNGNQAGTNGNQPGIANGNTIAQQPPPIRPINSLNQPVGNMIAAAPAPYYATSPQTFHPAINASASGNQGGFYGNRWNTGSYAAAPNQTSVNPYVNNPTPNAGLNPNWNQANTMVASRPANPFNGLFNRSGPLFSSGPFMASNGGANPGIPTTQIPPPSLGSSSSPSGANYIASNPNGWGNTTGFRPVNPLSIPFFGNSASSSGLSFRPQTPSYPTNNMNWGLSPVDNYRDPTQSGIPSSVIR